MDKFERTLRCPFCGYETKSRSIGTVYCGPHKVGADYFPAVPMREAEQLEGKDEEA